MKVFNQNTYLALGFLLVTGHFANAMLSPTGGLSRCPFSLGEQDRINKSLSTVLKVKQVRSEHCEYGFNYSPHSQKFVTDRSILNYEFSFVMPDNYDLELRASCTFSLYNENSYQDTSRQLNLQFNQSGKTILTQYGCRYSMTNPISRASDNGKSIPLTVENLGIDKVEPTVLSVNVLPLAQESAVRPHF